MTGWTCPRCQRLFGRTRQSHECAPAMTLEEYFSTGPPHERPIFEAVLAFLETLGPMHVEPVSVGIFVKTDRSFIELRPRHKWVNLGLGSTDDHRVIRLNGPEDVDDALKAELTKAYERNQRRR
ncbi:MAG TPA: hypothetical protein VM933_01590 [Acidimicrobiales bacterium]|nr:hypothetical protein [Acidimicrobiales bacterium]